MRRCWLSSAAVLFSAATAWADPAVTIWGEPQSAKPVSAPAKSRTHVVAKPSADGSAATPCETCGRCDSTGHGGRLGHGPFMSCLRGWLCVKTFRPGECTDTPTGYQPPLYTYFPCKGTHGHCATGGRGCDPRLFQVGLPPTPVAPAQVLPQPAPVAAPTTAKAPVSPPRPHQGPVLPGSAFAAAQPGVGPSTPPRPAASPYSLQQTSASERMAVAPVRPEPRPVKGAIPVYVPSFSGSRPGR